MAERAAHSGLVPRLERLRLLRDAGRLDEGARALPPTPEALVRLGEFGVLAGGLSVELEVRADELFGPLQQLLGGGALKLKLVDVRDPQVGKPSAQVAPELTVELGELRERWEPETLPVLVHNLNDLFLGDPTVRAVAELGEWNGALVLWAVEKKRLPELLREPFFVPRNRELLERISERTRG